MRTPFRRTALLAFVAVAAACGKDNPTEPQLVFPEGLYELITINDSPLPYQYPNSTHTTLSGTFNFLNGSNWELVSENCDELPCDGDNVGTMTVVGTYSISGTTITFQETSPGSLRFDGTFTTDAARLTLDVDHPRLGRSLRVYIKP